MDFFSALGAIPTIMGLFDKKTVNPYGKQQDAMAARMAQISAAQTDTSNPLYKQLYGQYQDQNRQNMAQTIAEAQAQNRMAQGMGRTPLFSPERGGENIFRNLMQGYQGMNQQADQQTRQALEGAATTTGNASTVYGNINKPAAMSNLSPLMGYQMAGNMAQNAFGGGQSTPAAGGQNFQGMLDAILKSKQQAAPTQQNPSIWNY